MSRKPKKGYFVKGVFVAEGSELDLELKAELKGTDSASKTDLKRESAERQELGEALLTLRADLRERLLGLGHLNDKLLEAVDEAGRITNFEGRRRQMQYVGKLMRQLDPDDVEAIRQALHDQHKGSAAETALLHQAEQWRDALIATEDALSDWMAAFPNSDSQQLRALMRQARKDNPANAKTESQGLAPRQGRAYRELFQIIKQHLVNHEQP
ncbi:MAG: ribosome biogenesis factor YjgA [Alphaproteobacteria bacterium]|nr:ribosome biogenesis factor YjgA [Alphaproteobacteria bacterium]